MKCSKRREREGGGGRQRDTDRQVEADRKKSHTDRQIRADRRKETVIQLHRQIDKNRRIDRQTDRQIKHTMGWEVLNTLNGTPPSLQRDNVVITAS